LLRGRIDILSAIYIYIYNFGVVYDVAKSLVEDILVRKFSQMEMGSIMTMSTSFLDHIFRRNNIHMMFECLKHRKKKNK
jgi:hypothetical protein